jgi:hypothetical protein
VFTRSFVSALDALATPHGIDRYLELIDPTWSLREVRAVVTEVRWQTADSVTLTLEPNRNWSGFEAGQHSTLTVEIDGVRIAAIRWRRRRIAGAASS